jgi:hypothetical protein
VPLNDQICKQALERYAVERVRYLMLADAVEQRVRTLVSEPGLRLSLHSGAMPISVFEAKINELMKNADAAAGIGGVDDLLASVTELACLRVLPYSEADVPRIVEGIAEAFGGQAVKGTASVMHPSAQILGVSLSEADCRGALVRLRGLSCTVIVNSLFNQTMQDIQQSLGSPQEGRVAGAKVQAGLRGLVQLMGQAQVALRKLVRLAGSDPGLSAAFDNKAQAAPQTRQLLPDGDEAKPEQTAADAAPVITKPVVPKKRVQKTRSILPDRTASQPAGLPAAGADLSANPAEPTPPAAVTDDEAVLQEEQFLHIDDFMRSMESLTSLPRDPLSRRELYNELLACGLQNRAAIIEGLLSGNWREQAADLIERFNEYAQRHALELRLGEDEQLTVLLASRCSRQIMQRVDRKLQKRKPRRIATIVMIMDKLR